MSRGRHQFEAYLDKVFDFSRLRADLPEGRQYPQHSWAKIFDAVFLGAVCQFSSLHRLENECRRGVLRKRIGALSEDTIRYALQQQSEAPVFALTCELARRLKRNGVLRSDWARGLVVAAADGMEICSSFVRCCDACLERTVQHKVGEQLREDIQYYHRLSAVTVVSTAFPVPLGLRFQLPGEDEVRCTLALVEELVNQLGRRFLDVLVADALYLRTPVVQAIEGLGLDWVINLKENQPELLAEARRTTSREPDYQQSEAQEQLRLWHESELYWSAADRSVRLVRTERSQSRQRLPVRPSQAPAPQGKETYFIESTNFYASNFQLGAIPPFFIHQLGRSRWRIDTEVFQTMTVDSHLKKASVHQNRKQAFVVLTMIRLLAYLLTMVFYHRQVRSHLRRAAYGYCELAQKLAYLFLVPRLDTG